MTDPLVAAAADLAGVEPAAVELTETHISRVALAGEPGVGVALKQCKAVDFGFVDLSTPAARRAALEKERVVNDRFAPGVYLGVVDLPGGEPALRMRRLDAADTLDAKVRRGEATAADLAAVLDHLLPLFEASDRRPEWGDPAVIRRNLIENLDVLDEAERRFGCDLSAAALRSEQLTCLSLLEPDLRRRAADGFVRDGHGDLRCEHVYLTADGVKVLDGIAWSDRLRCVDVADELCFLAVDLEHLLDERYADRSWGGLRYDLLDQYDERTDDPDAEPHCSVLLAFYECYRAAVRAKVACLRALNTRDDAVRADALREARRWVVSPLGRLAVMLETQVTVLVGGLSGSGKSTLAAAVAERLGGRHLRSDAVRKRLFGGGEGEPAPPSAYEPAASAQTYDVLHNLTQRAQWEGVTPVVDATFRDRAQRDRFVRLGLTEEPEESATVFVWRECDDVVAEARLAARAASGTDASDADVGVRRRQAVGSGGVSEEEFAGVPNASLLRLDTEAPVEALCDRVIDALRVAAGIGRQ